MPGPHLDPASIVDLFQRERVTITGGVPTIWMGVLQYLDANPGKFDLSTHPRDVRRRLRRAAGDDRGVREAVRPQDRPGVGHDRDGAARHRRDTAGRSLRRRSDDEQFEYRAKQGRPAPFVEIRARNEDGLVPWDGQTMGELEVRGPWIASAYYNRADSADRFTDDGWFKTGDIVTIDADATIQIQDRSKDLIKSGGEWISSVALECALMGHPAVAEAAVIPVDDREMERAAAGRRRAEAGRVGVAGRAARVPRAAVSEVLAARRVRVHRRDSAHVGRQVQEERAARSLQGLPGQLKRNSSPLRGVEIVRTMSAIGENGQPTGSIQTNDLDG